jgi:hypothetical protein
MNQGFFPLGLIGILIVTGIAIYNISSGKEVEAIKWLGGAEVKFRPSQMPTVTDKTQPSTKIPKLEPVVVETAAPKFDRLTPKQEIDAYFNDINSGLYEAAWDRLPTALQENKDVHPNQFKSFEEWYESMNSVDVKNVKKVNVAENNSDSAEFDVLVVYNFKNGKFVSNSLRFLLSWDSQAEKWRIAEIKIN